MSICRWSDDKFRCDLYIYQGWDDYYHVHVAGRRYITKEEMPEISWDLSAEEILKRYNKVHEILDRSELVDIDLPYAGESFTVRTAQELKDLVTKLKIIGYRVPEFVFNKIEKEMK